MKAGGLAILGLGLFALYKIFNKKEAEASPEEEPTEPVETQPAEPEPAAAYDFEIINPSFDNESLTLTLKNNNVPARSKKREIDFSVVVDLIKPMTLWTGGYGSQPYDVTKQSVFKWTPSEDYLFAMPAVGESVEVILSAVQPEYHKYYNQVKELISKGYLDPAFPSVRISKISINPSSGIKNRPPLPITVYRRDL